MEGLDVAVRVQPVQGRNAGALQIAAEGEQRQAASRGQVQVGQAPSHSGIRVS